MNEPENELEIAILATLAQIPKGKVCSYGIIAEKAAYKGRARYVGFILKNLPKDSSLPWYRVLKSSGHLAFPESDTRHTRQKALLEAEGIAVISGKVNIKRHGW